MEENCATCDKFSRIGNSDFYLVVKQMQMASKPKKDILKLEEISNILFGIKTILYV